MTGADELEQILCDGRILVDRLASTYPDVPQSSRDRLLRDFLSASALGRAAVLFEEHNYSVGIDLVVLAHRAALQLAVSEIQDPSVASAMSYVTKLVTEEPKRASPGHVRLTEAEIELLCQAVPPTRADGEEG